MSVPNEIPVYHFTDASNLPGILGAGRIFCKSRLPNALQKTDISHYDVQQRRHRKPVECRPGGILHDYVPFYFAPRSPMMYAIAQGSVEGCNPDTKRLVYLVSSVEEIQKTNQNFVFTDGHATKAFTQMYDDPAHLDELDWPLMNQRYWHDTDEDNDRSRRRQAELLVHEEFFWESIEFIAVKNMDMKRRLENYLHESWPDRVRPVESRAGWYF